MYETNRRERLTVIKRVKMTPPPKENLVKVGILDESGKLTKEYCLALKEKPKLHDFIFSESNDHHYTIAEMVIVSSKMHDFKENDVLRAISDLLHNRLVLSKHMRLYKK